MADKIRLLILFGGRSGEHEISLLSARSVLSALNPERYEIIQVGITHNGQWVCGDHLLDKFQSGDTSILTPVTMLPEPGRPILYKRRLVNGQITLEPWQEFDVAFPILHGTYGEDGTIQGLFEMASVAYVGAGVLGSSVGMDKAVFKEIMRSKGIPILNGQVFSRAEIERDPIRTARKVEKIGKYPLFTKPANLGSSVGIQKCRDVEELIDGLQEAALYDRRILVEQGLEHPLEIEVSVMGNEAPIVSIPGEIVPSDEFYSYQAKYIDNLSELRIPALLPENVSNTIRSLAARAYQAIDCAGMARVDFLVDRKTYAVYLNEVNTIPGFTAISMYPKLWETTGIPYSELIDRLVDLALQRKQDRDRTLFEYRRMA